MANALMSLNTLSLCSSQKPGHFAKSFHPSQISAISWRSRLVVKAQSERQNSSGIRVIPSLKKFQKIALIASANAVTVLPAMAIEKAALFDFNLTLPIIAAEFLLLMVALDKIWFTPLGKFMDERDEMIRQKLMSVRDNSEEIKKMQEQGEAMLRAARAEVAAALNKMKNEMTAELEEKLDESRKRVEKELVVALEKLDAQKQETLRSLEEQIEDVSQQIVRKVLPFKV
eukprot:TRINITY_DN58_c0_g1_i1.p1 TRINITY_DN58_c0_g1~~TRINITY_DN58_c0_g1_i1.p1  ORF type:complete len:229 (+),score=35.80 TRINITY_DN58_c0_g1_i1:203-889(+)